jgi:hypothetical protein
MAKLPTNETKWFHIRRGKELEKRIYLHDGCFVGSGLVSSGSGLRCLFSPASWCLLLLSRNCISVIMTMEVGFNPRFKKKVFAWWDRVVGATSPSANFAHHKRRWARHRPRHSRGHPARCSNPSASPPLRYDPCGTVIRKRTRLRLLEGPETDEADEVKMPMPLDPGPCWGSVQLSKVQTHGQN